MAVAREKYMDFLRKQKDKDIVKIITGIRRCGKSTLLFELFYEELKKTGIPDHHIIKIAFDNIRNEALLDAKNLYFEIERRIKDEERYYIFLDEIQMVADFEDVVNGIKRDFNCDVYITGSNSEFLSSDIRTKFRGRGIELHVQPFSLKELYDYEQTDKHQLLNQYMLYGGMPYLVQEEDAMLKNRYLKTVAESVQMNDIIERHGIRNNEVFQAMVELLCSSIGTYVSSRKIADTLKSNGHSGVDHKTVGNYLNYLCDAFLFYKVQRYDIKGRAYLKTLHKYYACDIGIRNAILNFRQLEPTHAIENIVYLELIRRGYLVDIGSNRNKEIDFMARDMNHTYYIQVSYSVLDPSTRAREIGSFKNLDDGYKKIVITMDNDPFTNLENGYKKVNMLDFLLDEKCLENI